MDKNNKYAHKWRMLLEQVSIFYVAQKLASMGWIVHSTGFGSPIDLIIEKNHKLRTLQIKGTLKRHLEGYGTFYHFMCVKDNFYERYSKSVDYLILVCMDKEADDYVVKKVVVFPKEQLPKGKGIRIFIKHHDNIKKSKYVELEDRWDLII